MSYLDWDWNGPLKYQPSFLQNPHISEIVVECAQRQLIQDVYDIPKKRPVNFIGMCSVHGIPTDLSKYVTPLQRETYRLFKLNCEDAFEIVEGILKQKDDSPYYQSFQSCYEETMKKAPPVYRNQIMQRFNLDIFYTKANRDYLHSMASDIEKIDYERIKIIPANGRRGPTL